MLKNFYKTPFIVYRLTETKDPIHKTLKKEYAQVYSGKGALVTLSQSKTFTNDRDQVLSSYLLYAPADSLAVIRDKVTISSRDYEVVQVLPDIKSDHLEIYLSDYKVK